MVKLSVATSSKKSDSDVLTNPKYAGLRDYWKKVQNDTREKILEALRNLDKDKPFLNLNELTEAVGHSSVSLEM